MGGNGEYKENETGGDNKYDDDDISADEFKQQVADKVEGLLHQGCFMRNSKDSQVCHIRSFVADDLTEP